MYFQLKPFHLLFLWNVIFASITSVSFIRFPLRPFETNHNPSFCVIIRSLPNKPQMVHILFVDNDNLSKFSSLLSRKFKTTEESESLSAIFSTRLCFYLILVRLPLRNICLQLCYFFLPLLDSFPLHLTIHSLRWCINENYYFLIVFNFSCSYFVLLLNW